MVVRECDEMKPTRRQVVIQKTRHSDWPSRNADTCRSTLTAGEAKRQCLHVFRMAVELR